ncbi:PQQ-binding-like beta-propeller repeat protein [Sorangium sp. So ce269]
MHDTCKSLLVSSLLVLGTACSGGVHEVSSSSEGGGSPPSSSFTSSSSTGGGGSPPSSSSTSSSSTGGAATCASLPPSRGNGAFTTAWAAAFGDGTSFGQGSAIAADASGNVILVGDAYGPVDLGSGVSFFSHGRFIAKLDPEGHPLWASAPTVLPARVAADAQGSLWTTTTPDVSGVPHSIVKRGPDGEELWSKSLPGEMSALSPTGAGGVVLIAQFSGSFDYGGASFSAKGDTLSDVLVLALDASGAVAWSTTIAAPLAPPPAPEGDTYMILSAPDVVAMPSGGALVQALVTRGDRKSPETHERLLQRLGPNGEVLWARTLPAQGYSPEIRLAAAPDDGALIVAAMGAGGSADLGCSTHHGPGLLLQALDARGQPRWERSIHGNMGATRPRFDAAGNLVLVGMAKGSIDLGGDGNLEGNSVDFRIFVARYAPDGAHLASRTYEGTPPPDAGWLFPGESRAEGSAVDPSGNVLLTGYYSGALDFGTGAFPDVPILEGPYMTRGFVVKLAP